MEKRIDSTISGSSSTTRICWLELTCFSESDESIESVVVINVNFELPHLPKIELDFNYRGFELPSTALPREIIWLNLRPVIRSLGVIAICQLRRIKTMDNRKLLIQISHKAEVFHIASVTLMTP